MELPNYVDNKVKYNRAIENAKNPNNAAEVKALYVSYGGNLIGEEVVLSETNEEIKVEEPIIVEAPVVVEEVVAEVLPEATEEVVAIEEIADAVEEAEVVE